MKKNLLFFIALFAGVFTLFAQPIYNEAGIRLYHTPSQEEMDWARNMGLLVTPKVPTSPPSGELRPIAEFEPAEAVLVRYPFGIPVNLIAEMSQDVIVITIVASTGQQSTVLSQYNSAGVKTANCKFLIANSDTYWTRDYGPWFMAINNSTVGMFDFTYNRPARVNDNQINSQLAPFLSSAAGGGIQIDRYTSTLVLTGGNYMNDGIDQGFSTTLVLQENTGLTEQQIKNQYLLYFGIDQQHFIADPIVPYDNIQHIDCSSKMLAPNKVLVDSVAPNAPNYNKFEAVANYFRTRTSSWGMPYKVVRVFAPGATSSNPTTPYSNSLILNKKVFVPVNPTTNANDLAALAVYEQAMPGYDIIPINYNGWLNTDALHCRTHEIADRCMLYIKHLPIFGEIENTGPITFSTELYSYCNNTIYSDSVIVYIKSNGGEYAGYNMTNTAANTWETTVSLPNGWVEYYIFAADQSGRRECHPYIGKYDPHKFKLIGNATPEPALSLSKTSSSVTIPNGVTVVKDTITISNVGTADLTFEIVDIDFPVKFTVTPDKGMLQPNNSQMLILTYDISTTKKDEAFFGSFKLLSNDPLHPETEITLEAIVLYSLPVLGLDKTSSVVTSEGATVIEDTITISNLGAVAELTFEITALDFHEMLRVSPLSGTIQPDNSQKIILSYDFANVEKGEYTGSFKLLSNDPTHLKTEISLYARQNHVGIKETNRSTTYIYPNPASDKINIVFNGERATKANIYNILGVQLNEATLTKGINTMDIKTLPKGIYFIKIEGSAFKFVKQ